MYSFKAIVGVLIFLLVAGIVVMSAISYQNNENTMQTSRWLSHTHKVIESAEELLSRYQEIRLKVNSMVITRDTSKHREYLESMKALVSDFNELKKHTTDNPYQQPNLDSLERGLQKFTSISDTLFKRVGENTPQVDLMTLFASNNDIRESVTSTIKKVKTTEKALLAQRELANQESLSAFKSTFAILLTGIAILLGSTFLVVRYNFNKSKMAEEQIKQALESEKELNNMKSNFVTMASHEFRTPLTAIVSSADLLSNYKFVENQDRALRHISRIKSSVRNLTSILDEFLSVTRIEEGRIKPNLEKIDIQKHLELFCKNAQGNTRPGQVIIYDHTGHNEISTDPVLFDNIVNNMVSNAIKYSPENSAIYLSSHVDGMIRLTVKDNGIGIPENEQTQIFNRFYRASNVSNVQGTGLGLHIMKHYVEMLKGSVKLNSEVGKGTTVEVCFDNSL